MNPIISSNVLLDGVGAIITFIIILSETRELHRDKTEQRLYYSMLTTLIIIFVLDVPAWTLDGSTFHGAGLLLWILDTGYYAAQIVFCYFWLLFSDYWSFQSKERIRKFSLLYAVPMFIELGLIFTTYWTGWVFTFSEDNVYERGSLYLLNLLPYYTYIIMAFAVSAWGLSSCTDPYQKRRRQSICVFMLLPVCGTLLATMSYGVSWIWPFSALSLMMVHIYSQQQRIMEERLLSAKEAEYSARLDTELAQSRIAIMLSQIQPHFLFNSLSTISELCREDPEKARKATIDFSDFLRRNIDSLQEKEPVDFAVELRHAQAYLELEKCRYEDELQIEYDIQTTAFKLPSLTLQPLVENAVKYGVGKSQDGGRVIIGTREYDDCFVITVTDDGAGFDPEVKKEDGRSHVGIENVRGRLSSMSGALLELFSAPGEGTTVKIILPKGDADDENSCG